ncbi:unnamed protein product [Ostreobium quekettii]|uniref:Uncharacterized protein n=1 Tax=Ostreobium quekettii TaxID=121088 RepID=A0A8S1JAZ3_9CHLO|nr:unnamed protein product [Ostreobium quekettii]
MKPGGMRSAAPGALDATPALCGALGGRQVHSHWSGVDVSRRPKLTSQQLDQVAHRVTAVAHAEVEGLSRPDLSAEYCKTMQQQMGSPSLEYRHQDGMNYTRIWDDVIVGSCVQTPGDVDWLVEKEGVSTIVCLQEDKDCEYWDLDLAAIKDCCTSRGDVKHLHLPIRDFDPQSLRQRLPKIVAEFSRQHERVGGAIYIHCTAGLGRAPAAAIAYMYWCKGWKLKDAVDYLVARRPCGPKIFAIREATADVLYWSSRKEVQISVVAPDNTEVVQVAGLDIGWGSTLTMDFDPATQRYVTRRLLSPGRFQFKFVMDGNWWCSADYPAHHDGPNRNNYIEVTLDSDSAAAVDRLVSEEGVMTLEESWRMVEAMQRL